MTSENELGVGESISEREARFVPRSDDEEVLWEVVEITAERGSKYKVKWAGLDPATRKPWAQSWVAKTDCTDALVIEWKAKKKRVGEKRKKRGRQTSTASRTSSTSRQAAPVRKTRRSPSEATTSRLVSPPSKPSGTKRKRQSTTPATTTSGTGQADEPVESRPRKKQRLALEVTLLPPVSSSDEDEDASPSGGDAGAKAVRDGVVSEPPGAPLERSVAKDGSSRKAKGKDKLVRHSDSRSNEDAADSRASASREASTRRGSKTKVEVVVPLPHARVADVALSEDGTPRLRSKKKRALRYKSPLEQGDSLSEKEVAPEAVPTKVGPPRGGKRTRESKMPGQLRKPESSRAKSRHRDDSPADEPVPIKEPTSHRDRDSTFGKPLLLQNDIVDEPGPASPPPRVSTPPALPNVRMPSLSPGARARLELFDRMVLDAPQPDVAPSADIPVPDDVQFDFNETHKTFEVPELPRVESPPPPKSKPKPTDPGTSNGLVVPETESSGNSQSQSQPLPMLPPPPPPAGESPRKLTNIPPIAVIAASPASSPSSPDDLFRLPPKVLPSPCRPQVKPVPQISPNTFRAKIKGNVDADAPLSSIESFTSPKRLDKGKQKAIEVEEFSSGPSASESDDEQRKTRAQKRVTDSGLKKRGKVLFDQAQPAWGAVRQKKKPKRLKAANDIVNRRASSSPKPSLPFTNGAEKVIRCEEAINLTGGADDATLDTTEHTELKDMTKEERERLRITLRREEEESTQEAMGIHPTNEPILVNGASAPMPPLPNSPERTVSNGQIDDTVDRVELPSADFQLASVIVQPSQGHGHGHMDTDVELPPSSLPRPIPERLTDSPERRLGDALALLNVKSEEIRCLEQELISERKTVQRLETELAELRQSSEPTEPVRATWEAERKQWTQERSKWEENQAIARKDWVREMANLDMRAIELSEAAADGDRLRVQISELEAERDEWIKDRDALREDLMRRTDELAMLTKANSEDSQSRSEWWEAERASWAEERARWESERAALQEKHEGATRSVDELTATIESLSSAKVSAEKDRDFFREQYAQASGFVSSVREENVELEEKAKIAEGQAREGVAAIKALYEGRVKVLQGEIDRWKATAELLQEKDRRTNDELRLRAAQAPELADLCNHLAAENKSLVADIRKLDIAKERGVVQRNRLYYEIMMLKKERASLRLKLSKRPKTKDGGVQGTPGWASPAIPDPNNDTGTLPEFTPPSSGDSQEEPMLFPCLWRPDWRDQCQHVFDTKEDLERHFQEHLQALINQDAA